MTSPDIIKALRDALEPIFNSFAASLAMADSLQKDLYRFDDDAEVDLDDLDFGTHPILWGDFRRIRAALTAFDNAPATNEDRLLSPDEAESALAEVFDMQPATSP